MAKKSKPIPTGEVVTGNVLADMDGRFLSSVDLEGCGDVELTIDRIEHLDEIEYNNGRKDQNVKLMYFAGTPKPYKLNKTNAVAITHILQTKMGAGWTGKKIKFCVKTVPFGKGTKRAIRVVA